MDFEDYICDLIVIYSPISIYIVKI